MLLSDLHCMDRRLSAILRSGIQDIEMYISDDENEESKQDPYAAMIREIIEEIETCMTDPCTTFNLEYTGKIDHVDALGYEMYIEQKNKRYTITVGWNEPENDEFVTYFYHITDGEGYEGDGGGFNLDDSIDQLTEELSKITKDILRTIPEEK